MAIGAAIYWQLVGQYGQTGLASASVITMAGYTIHLALAWHRQTPRGVAGGVLKGVVRSGGSAVIAATVGWYAVKAVAGAADTMSLAQGFAGLAVGAVVVGALYLTGTTVTGGPELRELRVGRRTG